MLKSELLRSVLICGLVACGAVAGADAPVKALFLGDNGHHVPAERFKNLQPPMAERGITLTYTDKLDDLNPTTLGAYDVLIIYANHTRISPEQEKALLDFVASGRGLVPIHCASACFGNSPAYIELVGGRFLRHGTGVFKDTIVAPEHPSMKGLKVIESWDETYVHDRTNPDRVILANRVDDKGAEGYTWVRTHGKGRVFYTAWGHDQRTWMNASFIDLIERGIRWSAGSGAVANTAAFPDLKPRADLKPPATKEAEGPIPIYLNSGRWGTGGKPLTTMQAPLPPAESQPHFIVPPGFEVQLWASEPDIVKPICMTWDERGRLWIAETVDYPNDLQPAGQGHDRIKICEDTKGAGRADKFTVFAENLSIPTSLACVNGGVIVHQAPETLFLKATKGDDKADVRKTLFSGWGIGDTHAGPSNLKYGFDNWVYGMVGYAGFRSSVGGKNIQHSQGFYRFMPDGSQYDFLRSTNNNTWGFGWSEDGIVFGSTANGCPSVYMPIANRYYESVAGFSPARLETIATSNKFTPLASEKVRQVDFFGGYTAAAGHALYTARAFPKEYWNRVAFVTEPTGHLIGQFILDPRGADFTAMNMKSFAASDDEWTAPIMAEVGPDGALWVIDWYNFIVQHNPTPAGFKTGRRAAYETPLRDKRHGRIYRIVHKDAKPYTPINIADAAPEKLVETLKSDNLFWRMTAQRLLVERKADVQSAIPALCELVKDTKVDEIGLNAASIHALWSLHGLGALSGQNAHANAAAIGALKHAAASTRRAAAQTIPRTEEGLTALLDAKLLDDSDAQVRMAALLALSEMPASEAAGAAVFTMLKQDRNNKDKWIPHAAISAAARHDAGFLKAALGGIKVDPKSVSPLAPREGAVPAGNVFTNPSFETEANGVPNNWRKSTHGGSGELSLANVGHTGKHSVQIASTAGGDISWATTVDVRANTDYKLSGWIKTENVRGTARGALFNVHELQQQPGGPSRALQGTNDWTKIETSFNTGSLTRITINCLFGGWGRSTGTAWYDDLELVAVGSKSPPLPGELGRALQVVTGHYARRGPVDSVLQTLAALKDADAALALPILDGLASGWPQGKAPDIKEADAAILSALMKSLPESARGSLLGLAERWGKKDIFAADAAAISKQLEGVVADVAKTAEARADAAKRMLALSDTPEHVQSVLAQITPQGAPALSTGLLAALGESKLPDTAASIIAAWKKFSPAAQRAALVTLLRRTEWTMVMLNAVEKNTLKTADIPAEFWTQLKNNPEAEVSAKARSLEKSGGAATKTELQELIEKLKPLTLEAGDIEKGKVAFEKTCMVCHMLNGKGGQVGPLLTGFGAHPKEEILTAIVDPNRSVEANFRLWNCKTNEGLVISGRLESESQTSIEILDAEAKKHIIERKDIKVLMTNNLSIMPEGMTEKMTPEDLKGILEYISQSKVKPEK